ncbi:hypothetical protein BUALT_Bualt04G0144000 [Buddleja alternifolia]|uniref:Uncharacterized protein n=1 Tax=Buddleja alternifolia TaxID=168488 RepID=A0AAV6XR23_9LAMI|nr:hypothetical protein BUALT_Bualt04G0144000 [Buddleja alternifolia]
MIRSCFRTILLQSFILVLLFSTGFGRKMVNYSGHAVGAGSEEGKSREMMELDYNEKPEPNVNGKSGIPFPFPSPPPPPPAELRY